MAGIEAAGVARAAEAGFDAHNFVVAPEETASAAARAATLLTPPPAAGTATGAGGGAFTAGLAAFEAANAAARVATRLGAGAATGTAKGARTDSRVVEDFTALGGQGFTGAGVRAPAVVERPFGAVPPRASCSILRIISARGEGLRAGASIERSASPGFRPLRSVASGSAPVEVSNHLINSSAPA